MQLQDVRCEAPWGGRTLWSLSLPFTRETQGTRQGDGNGSVASPPGGRAGPWTASDGQSRPGPAGTPGMISHLPAKSVHTALVADTGAGKQVLLGE